MGTRSRCLTPSACDFKSVPVALYVCERLGGVLYVLAEIDVDTVSNLFCLDYIILYGCVKFLRKDFGGASLLGLCMSCFEVSHRKLNNNSVRCARNFPK